MAVKKYHNDIGSRLSEMLGPEKYTNDHDENLSQDFCMLTIDRRPFRGLHQKENIPRGKYVSRVESCSDDTGLELSSETSPYTTPSTSSMSHTAAERENRPRKKRHIFDKFTCSLFLRKHLCARCKRRSRSCVSNKSITGTEKRYICCKCRETSQTLRHIFDEHSSFKGSVDPHSTKAQSLGPDSKEHNVHIPRKNIKDSGYDTVTSCSTVASAFSAFSTPANTRPNNSKDKTAVLSVMYGGVDLSSGKDTNRFAQNCTGGKLKKDLHIVGAYSEPDISSETTADSESELCNFQVDDRTGSTDDELIQLKPRNVQRRDGYSPKTDQNSWDKNKPRPILSDTSNLDDASVNGDYCYFPPRIIRVTQPGGENTTDSKKACYTCDSTSKPCFRLPWEGGWICEDCLDGLH